MTNDSPYRPVLEQTLGHALAYLDELEIASVAPTATLKELRARLKRPLNDDSLDAAQVIDELVRDSDPEAHRAAMSYRASYLTHDDDARDAFDWTPEWSRRGRGIATYAAIRQLGRNGIAELIERCCHHAAEIVAQIGELDGAEILWPPTVNQGLVRFLDSRPGATDADHDRRTDEVVAAIAASGEAFFSVATWRGKRCMRVSVVNWQTNSRDVERAVRAVKAVEGVVGKDGGKRYRG